MDREVLCKYPSTRPYTRRGNQHLELDLGVEQGVTVVAQQADLTVSAPTVPLSWNDESFRPFWDQGEAELNGDNSAISPPMLVKPRWFLLNDSWAIHEYELEDI
jgi:hypothetical protein